MAGGWSVTDQLRQWLRQRFVRLTSALVLLWWITLWWGERHVFARSAQNCDWHLWETWPSDAVPHRLLLIADPQLVDPHTYPGRGQLLNSLTYAYTDRYLRRANFYLHERLQPDTTVFLGDLFDGGREWATTKSESPEEQYRQYDHKFWLAEYIRFSDIFLWNALRGPLATAAAPMGRRIIASLPGNHDLGFAQGIQTPVKDRFDAFFGPLNRVDVLGNHSIVSLDTVSLSAMDQPDPETGSSGAGDGTSAANSNSHIWKPVEDFLVEAKTLRQQAVRREAANWDLISSQLLQQLDRRVAGAFDLRDEIPVPPQAAAQPPNVPSALYPTILLSHVPLFRAENTACGPAREGSPSIRLAGGYQYQNVLTPLVSSDIIKHLSAAEVVQIYSGDDHDYCEIEHSEFTGRIREVTVKSISWAMGIRRPGVQLVSLWNPIDADKFSTANEDTATPRDTLQDHLCLFPDQLGIFIRYAQILGLTLVVLAMAAVRYKPPSPGLPDTLPPSDRHLESGQYHHRAQRSTSTSTNTATASHYTSNNANYSNRLHRNPRLVATKPSSTPLAGYGNIPASSRSSSPSKHLGDNDGFAPASGAALVDRATNAYPRSAEKGGGGGGGGDGDDDDDDYDDWGVPGHKSRRHRRPAYRGFGPPRTRLRFFVRSVWEVVVPVAAFYGLLIWHG